jgi:hypothetical protein
MRVPAIEPRRSVKLESEQNCSIRLGQTDSIDRDATAGRSPTALRRRPPGR